MNTSADVVAQEGHGISARRPKIDIPWWSFTKTVIAAATLALVRKGGAGATVAVYHLDHAQSRTAVAFSPGDDQGKMERCRVLSLASSPAKEEA